MKHRALIIESDSARKKAIAEIIRLMGHECHFVETMQEALDFFRKEIHYNPTYIICEQELQFEPKSKLKNSQICLMFIEQASEICSAPIIIQSPPHSLEPEDCSKFINQGAWKVVNEISASNPTLLLDIINDIVVNPERSKKYLPFKGGILELHPTKLVMNKKILKNFNSTSPFNKIITEIFYHSTNKKRISTSYLSRKYKIQEKTIRTIIARFRLLLADFFMKEFNMLIDPHKMLPNDNGYYFSQDIKLVKIEPQATQKDFASIKTTQRITPRQREIINLFSRKRRLTRSAIEEKTGYSKSVVKKELAALAQKGILRFQGYGLRGYWEIIERDWDY